MMLIKPLPKLDLKSLTLQTALVLNTYHHEIVKTEIEDYHMFASNVYANTVATTLKMN